MSRNVVEILALVLLSLLMVSADHTPIQTRIPQRAPPKTAPYFLYSVCDAEIQQLCPSQEDAPLKCLLQHFNTARRNTRRAVPMHGRPHLLHAYPQSHKPPPQQQLQSLQKQPEELNETQPRRANLFGKECSSWLRAREVCVTYVRRTGRCRASETARECLRRVPASLLPPGCRNTDYHRSVILYGEMKRQKGT
ncbi:hypothetical protein LSM04_008178 [Trypanosoma melophagium]|uniref:uncharacterized protein n=1 Tax=Trypanosoma melophagium TaxID=715481 RepID=UPI003519FCC3|nr:hypothetical protein LSM04_008178 [Trypanosoma melophagium]